MSPEEVSMITESTFEPRMRRTMERLEEKLHRGETTVHWDIREALHIISRMVALEQDCARAYSMIYGQFKDYRDHFNLRAQSSIVPSSASPRESS